MKTFRLTGLDEAITVATTLTKSWFRGHSRAIGELVPRLYRPEFWDPCLTALLPYLGSLVSKLAQATPFWTG